MSSRWFRFYDDALNDPKVQTLPGDLFKTWVNLLCIASKGHGQLPVISELAYLLRRRSDHLQRDINALVERGLIDLVDEVMQPHNWAKRQYKSDTSATRMRRHRERKSDVTDTVTVTHPEYRVQNTDTEEDPSLRSGARAKPKRGTRLPDDWLPDIDDQSFAVSLGLTRERAQAEFEKFRDYWHARAGPGGVKLDWSATWRNWCRKAVESGGGNGGSHGQRRGPGTLAAVARQLADEARDLERAAGIGRAADAVRGA